MINYPSLKINYIKKVISDYLIIIFENTLIFLIFWIKNILVTKIIFTNLYNKKLFIYAQKLPKYTNFNKVSTIIFFISIL